MKKIFHLSTCDTCQRILKDLEPSKNFMLQDIKNEAITPDQLESMARLSGSYESLFSKRARLYKERNLKEQKLSEADYKALILEHYTFLKRPVIIIDNDIFVGNSKAVVASAKAKINS
ncbi:arsenate reductase family protein [Arenibacter echinorum]|uniref:Arsenate reductase-like glutaredoxin family protein n=1 Tax=Arenibacter echinorum TaxID=440515 RepID=A0A327RJK5_9FLAO|nr:ArsC/Spx/MgsR family protein [Arenibacter echinorum]RAJ13877.1 arsenate reductase-like glutaredoxin family protein [Arenibacter echinorum]